MKNLISAIEDESAKNFREFTFNLLKVRKHDQLNTYPYKDLLSPNKILKDKTLKESKNYLLERKSKKLKVSLQKKISSIQEIFQAGDLNFIKILVEWKKSRIWGMNPTAEIWVQFFNKEDEIDSDYFRSSSISGYGYDKLSTAVAEALNQSPQVLKLLYSKKNKKPLDSNRELLGYGSGHGILPRFEGGVGIESHRKIFENLGFKWQNIANGKTFGIYTVKKIKK